MNKITGTLAEITLNYKYENLPERVIHQAKRHLLDTIACAIGGYNSNSAQILLGVINKLGGRKESSIIGIGEKTTCLNAALLNGIMTRFLDLNDFQTHVSHPSEVIPPILAIGEARCVSGRKIIEAIVTAYEVLGRITSAMPFSAFSAGGWNSDSKAGIVIPAIAGKLINMNKEQIENAIGIAGSRCMVLGIVDAPKEKYTMAKNLRFPFTAYLGLFATLLAEQGFTGPCNILEGQYGFIDVVLNGSFDYSKLLKKTKDFQIMNAGLKRFCSCYSTHSLVQATLEVVEKYDIQPENIEAIKVELNQRTFDHTTDLTKRYPDNKETADHSVYYITSIIILEHMLGPDQYKPEKFMDKRVRELIEKISIFHNPELDQYYPSAKIEVLLKNGIKYSNQVRYPKGHYSNPLSDNEIIDKFKYLSNQRFNDKHLQEIINKTFNLEKINDINKYMKLFKFDC